MSFEAKLSDNFGLARKNLALKLRGMPVTKKRALSGKTSAPAARLLSDMESAILDGRMPPGSRLPGETELCTRYCSGRSAVREALQALKARGLIVSRRGSGSYVSTDAGQDPLRKSIEVYSSLQRGGEAYLELLDLRLLIETFCVERLAQEDHAAEREKLRAKLEIMRGHTGDFAAFGAADIHFHLQIVESAGHQLFSTILGGLLPGLGVRFASETYVDAALVAKNLRDHEGICAALDAGQAELARERLRSHLLDSRAHLEEVLAAGAA